MANCKVIYKKRLINNINHLSSFGKKIMAMVKADAYGHNMYAIVKVLKGKVKNYGVANYKEALKLKHILNDNSLILVVGKTSYFLPLIKNNIHITIDSISELKTINNICKKHNIFANVHIAINTGMNRIGVKSIKQFKTLINYIKTTKYIRLKGIFTHAFDADENNTHLFKQIKKLKKYLKFVNFNILIHIGGSYCLNYNLPNFINMVRVGFFMYGYGNKNLKPIMQITSTISKITKCKRGEYVGYGKTKLKENKKIALVGIGYSDGLPRNLSNIGYVKIKNQKCKIIGKICMDMFMVDVTYLNIKVGDKVDIMINANILAKQINTSPYEILTNFSKFRGKTLVI